MKLIDSFFKSLIHTKIIIYNYYIYIYKKIITYNNYTYLTHNYFLIYKKIIHQFHLDYKMYVCLKRVVKNEE